MTGSLRNNVILVITPQAWGNMLISKHHYALELAKRGNEVYFLNPPDNEHWSLSGKASRIKIRPSLLNDRLYFIDQQLYFPYWLKFHARKVFHFLIGKQIRDILATIGKRIDIIWSFDLENLFPLSLFKKDIYKVFHPVDEPGNEQAILAASGADIMFSVTKEILEKYSHYKVPAYFVNHGLAEEFFTHRDISFSPNGKARVGISGNLVRADLDRETLLQLVRENAEVEFHCFGSYQADASISGSRIDAAAEAFIDKLKSFKNVILHGVLKPAALSDALNSMDALLICYDIDKDQSKGTNYHKVMEYLSTGKVIVSNNITTYARDENLIRMVKGRSDNHEMPALFKETIQHLDKYNAAPYREARIAYAKQNSYHKQLDKIEALIAENNGGA